MANLCVTHLRTTSRAESALHASNLARSAIAAGIAKVLDNQDYGVEQLPDDTVSLETEHGTAYLTFNPSVAEDNDLAFSTNNAAGTTSVEGGGGRIVPANTVHLVARGFSGGVVREVETVLSVPTFPWALAANGEVIIRDGAVVGSLPEGVWPPSLSELEPADLVSNSTSSSAILLGSGSKVLGDVETPGGVVLADGTVSVEGQIRESAEPTTLPHMDPAELDPAVLGIAFDDITGVGLSGATLTAAAGAASPTALSGSARHDGELQLDQDLALSGALLYVNGNLRVNGNITGTGVIVVDGDLEVTSGVTLDGATKVAIVSSGKVTLRGVGPASSTIKGLFYAENGLLAEEITVIGAMIAAGDDAGVELVNSRAVSAAIVESGTAGTTTSSTTGGGGGGSSALGSSPLATTFAAFRQDGGGGGGGGLPIPGPGPTTTTTTAGGSSDSSSFIPLKERIKVVSWFEK